MFSDEHIKFLKKFVIWIKICKLNYIKFDILKLVKKNNKKDSKADNLFYLKSSFFDCFS